MAIDTSIFFTYIYIYIINLVLGKLFASFALVFMSHKMIDCHFFIFFG